MPRLFTHIMLSCAAILLLPQALDCCAHAHTVLESLAADRERESGADADAHAGHHEQHEVVSAEPEPARDGLDRSQVVTGVSPSGSGPALQSPSEGAGIMARFGDGYTTTSVRLPSAVAGIPTGWIDRPGTPPPR